MTGACSASSRNFVEPMFTYYKINAWEHTASLNENTFFFLNKNEFRIALCRMSTILVRPQYVAHDLKCIYAKCIAGVYQILYQADKRQWEYIDEFIFQ